MPDFYARMVVQIMESFINQSALNYMDISFCPMKLKVSISSTLTALIYGCLPNPSFFLIRYNILKTKG